MNRLEKINVMSLLIPGFVSMFLGAVDYDLHGRAGYGPMTYYVALPIFAVGMIIYVLTYRKLRLDTHGA